ncbi:Transcription factor TFIIIB component B [Tulasnella sp. 330]|nr:Transcription factor TFIIIB component B [Tulasnella sp. 330]KAG8887499.1 Transcription factor TFIIIB component B [Tulasnella sp. 332]
MFASSRLNKDGGKFKPVTKPRNPRGAESITVAPDSTSRDSSVVPATTFDGGSLIPLDGAASGPSMPPPSAIPGASTIFGSSIEQGHDDTPSTSSSRFETENMLSSRVHETQGYDDEYGIDQYISAPHFPDSYFSNSQSTSATSVRPQIFISIPSTSATKIIPGQGMSIVPPTRTTVAPPVRTRVPVATNRSQSVIAAPPTLGPSYSILVSGLTGTVQPSHTMISSSTQPSHPAEFNAEALPGIDAIDAGYSNPEGSMHGSKQKYRTKKPVEKVPEGRSSKRGKERAQNITQGSAKEKDSGNSDHEPPSVEVVAAVKCPPTRASTRKRTASSQQVTTSVDRENESSSLSDESDYRKTESSTARGKRKPRQKSASTTRPKKRRKLKKSVSRTGDGSDGECGDEDPDTSLPRQSRKRKQTALELLSDEQIPVGDDGEPLELDPEVVTMAQLCMDMGVGRPSTRTEESVTKAIEWKQKQRVIRQQARERQKARVLEAAKASAEKESNSQIDGTENGQGLHGDEPGPGGGGDDNDEDAHEGETTFSGISAATERLHAAEKSGELAAQAQSEQAEDADLGSLRSNRFAAQVRLDENGEIIMDDLSLTVDRHEAAREEARGMEYELVEEAEKDRFINSLTWSKKLTGQRWDAEETDLFYHYVGMWGTDFEMIALLMHGRTRREIRNKYNAEARKNPVRLDAAFATKIPIDLSQLSQATGLDFSKPAPEYPTHPSASLRNGHDGVEEQEEIVFGDLDDGDGSNDEGLEDGGLDSSTRAEPIDDGDHASHSPPPVEQVMRGSSSEDIIARVPVAVRVPIRTSSAPAVRIGVPTVPS